MSDLRFVGILLLIVVVGSACKPRVPADRVGAHIEMVAENLPPGADANDVQVRKRRALSMWRNGVPDGEPVIFYAVLTYPSHVPNALWLSIFHEDRDLMGIGIREERLRDDGQSLVREEQYPVYIHTSGDSDEVTDGSVVPVQIRDREQEMNAQQWAEYTQIHVDKLTTNWEESLPPVWISLPDPGRINVYVYVYDQSGHKSVPAELVVWDAKNAGAD